MENLYLKGQDVDTLLAVKKLDVGLNMLKLINSTADITSVDLEGTRANVVRKPDGKFNFDYIIDAFATSDKEESPSKPFIISLDKIKLKDIGVTFNDQQSRNDIKLYFKSFDTRVKTFDLTHNKYAVNDINLDGLQLKLKQDLVEEVTKKVEKKVDSLNNKNPMEIGLRGIKLTNFNIEYGDDNTKTFAKVLFKELSTKVNKLDLEITHIVLITCSYQGQTLMLIFIFLLRMLIRKTPKNLKFQKPQIKKKQSAIAWKTGSQ